MNMNIAERLLKICSWITVLAFVSVLAYILLKAYL